MPAKIEELTLEIDGVRTHCRRLPGEGVPTLYCHGNPTHGEEWLPFIEHSPGPALAIDMPGWGRSDRPDPADFDLTMHGLAAHLDRCLDRLEVGEHNLVVHDWGALALIGAQRHPERVRRLAVINAVPLLPGYRWHWVARLWRRRPLGEIVNATTTKGALAVLLRQARGDHSRMPAGFVDMIWDHWDRDTRNAVLALYRDADPDRLAAAGRDLGRLTCPSLVVWGDRDPYLPARFAEAYAQVLPDSDLAIFPGAGHWPWIDDRSVIDRVLAFIG